MAKDKITLDAPDVEQLGVVTKHHVKMQTDAEYRARALTPPGGNAPGEAGKDKDEPSGEVPPIPGVIANATATS